MAALLLCAGHMVMKKMKMKHSKHLALSASCMHPELYYCDCPPIALFVCTEAGKTFYNPCYAKCSGLDIIAEGPCEALMKTNTMATPKSQFGSGYSCPAAAEMAKYRQEAAMQGNK